MNDVVWPPLPDWFWYVIVFAYGAIVGSFLNVVIYRLPLGKHLSNPPSTCPACNYKLTFWDNIPLLSFVFLGARCRLCRNPISWRYFCVELLTACLWTLLYERTVTSNVLTQVDFVLQALVVSVLVALVFIDLDHFIAPDELTVFAAVAGFGRAGAMLALGYAMGEPYFPEVRKALTYFGWVPVALVGALAYAGLLFLVSFVTFIVYAREENETVMAVARRFFVFDDETVAVVQEGGSVDGAEAAQVPQPLVGSTPENSSEASRSESGEAPVEQSENVEASGEDEEGEAPRLAFSPAFLCGVSTLLMAPLLGVKSLGFFVVPFVLFVLISRRGDSVGTTARRFFQSADLGPPVTGDPNDVSSLAQQEADQFAKEAETGRHGGMGLGDAKLAIGLGAVLGPGLAMLSLGFATLFGAVTGVTLAARHGRSLRIGLPFVPFMAVGAIVSMLYGPAVVQWYSGFLYPEPVRQPTPAEVRRDEKARERRAKGIPDKIGAGAKEPAGAPQPPDPTR